MGIDMIKKKHLVIVVIFIILAIAIIPYIKAELLTNKYGNQFKELYKQTNMISDIEYMKVLDYNNEYSKVCYITANHKSSVIIVFSKENETWILDNWTVIWSQSGSANGLIWPFYL